jgi:hypothetical protein
MRRKRELCLVTKQILRYSHFVGLSWFFLSIEIALAIYSILLSMSTGQCFQDILEGSDAALLAPVILGWIMLLSKLLYCFLVACYRFFCRICRETIGEANRTKLALCTEGLCQAQKERIRKTNFALDLILLCWITSMYIFRFASAPDCIYQELIPTPDSFIGCGACEAVSWGFTMLACGGLFAGIMVKYFIVACECDFTIQSQLLERELLLQESNIRNSVLRWLSSPEARQVIMNVVAFVFCMIYLGGSALVFSYGFSRFQQNSQRFYNVVTSIAWFVRAFDAFTVGWLMIDVVLPWTAWGLYSQSKAVDQSRPDFAAGMRSKHPIKFSVRQDSQLPPFLDNSRSKHRIRSKLLRPFGLMSMSRKKIILALGASSPVPFAGVLASAHLHYINWAFYCLAFHAALVLLPMLLVHDLEVTMSDLIDMSAWDNFGLVMCRDAFIKGLKNVLYESRNFNSFELRDKTFDIKVKMFLASQARVDDCVAISYRWTSSGSNSQAVISMRNTCDGFDWIVMMTQLQAEMLVELLSTCCEDYVWMDQFCIPQQAIWSDSAERDILKFEVRTELVKRMTGLYTSARHVLVLNNSRMILDQEPLRNEDRYENRLWCMQEYWLPTNVTECDLSSRSTTVVMYDEDVDGPRDIGNNHLKSTRQKVFKRWFSSVPDDAFEQTSRALPILLDWLPSHQKMLTSDMISKRVQDVGFADYRTLVENTFASNKNDTLPALAQPWFGIVMTHEETKVHLIRAILSEMLKVGGTNEVVVIDNTRKLRDGTGERDFESGSMAVDRMLAGSAGGMETGDPIEVSGIVDGCKGMSSFGQAIQSELHSSILQKLIIDICARTHFFWQVRMLCTGFKMNGDGKHITCEGWLASPPWFNDSDWVTTLTFVPHMEAGTSLAEYGASLAQLGASMSRFGQSLSEADRSSGTQTAAVSRAAARQNVADESATYEAAPGPEHAATGVQAEVQSGTIAGDDTGTAVEAKPLGGWLLKMKVPPRRPLSESAPLRRALLRRPTNSASTFPRIQVALPADSRMAAGTPSLRLQVAAIERTGDRAAYRPSRGLAPAWPALSIAVRME